MSGPVKFLKSALLPQDYPDQKRPEVALAGRSNSGKSSFLNAISNSKVAMVSSTPGKTRLLNFFDFGQHYRIVDMPGYGFASRSIKEMEEWTQAIETYISERENLAGLVLLMDIRRDWTRDENLLVDFLSRADRPCLVVLTKADQVKRGQYKQICAAVERASGLAPVMVCSAKDKLGVKEVEDFVFKHWVRPALDSKGKE